MTRWSRPTRWSFTSRACAASWKGLPSRSPPCAGRAMSRALPASLPASPRRPASGWAVMPPSLARADRRKTARAKRPVLDPQAHSSFGGALLLAAAFALVVYIEIMPNAPRPRFDRLLAASALTIGGAVQLEAGRVTVELPLASFAMFSGEDRIFYAVESPQGRNVTGEADLSDGLAPATGGDPVFADKAFRDDRVRVASVGRLVHRRGHGLGDDPRRRDTRRAGRLGARNPPQRALADPSSDASGAAASLGRDRARLRSAPVAGDALTRALARRSLARRTPAPSETAQLVGALNGFTARLKLARERLEALVAEAAHEVRTPLASLRAQAELALAERDPPPHCGAMWSAFTRGPCRRASSSRSF